MALREMSSIPAVTRSTARCARLPDRLQRLRTERHVEADADHDARRASRLRTQLDEDAAELLALDHEVVRPLDLKGREARRTQSPQRADADDESQ